MSSLAPAICSNFLDNATIYWINSYSNSLMEYMILCLCSSDNLDLNQQLSSIRYVALGYYLQQIQTKHYFIIVLDKDFRQSYFQGYSVIISSKLSDIQTYRQGLKGRLNKIFQSGSS